MQDNRGLSLVELIVVIAILAILSTGALFSFGTVNNWRVNQATSSIDGGLNKARIVAMSKTDALFELSYNDGEYYMKITEEQDKKIAKDPITITYTTSAGETFDIKNDPLTLAYNRSSGAFLPVGTMEESGVTKDVYCTKITVTGRKTREIELIYLTGKHKVK